MPNYLITGGEGQLGQCFAAVAEEFPKIKLIFTDQNEVDITHPETLKKSFDSRPFDGIINCAAYTQVDFAEEEYEKANKINVEGLSNIGVFAEKKELCVVNFSSDYVFDGTSMIPYKENDKPNPINKYGYSKYNGELLLKKSSCQHITFRISWLFSPFGENFVKTILKLSKLRKTIQVVNDQHGRPTYGIDLARTVLKLISNNTIYTFPILHYANQGVCSWKEFAEAIVNELECKTIVQGITTLAYPTSAIRPKYSILDTGRIEKELQIEIPTWQESLKKCIQILKSDGSL